MRIGVEFSDLREIKRLFPQDMAVAGVGVTAWPRSGLGYLLPDYVIVSLFETADLEAVRQVCPVVSMEKDFKVDWPEKFNTSGILSTKQVRDWVKGKQAVFVYKASTVTDKLVKELGLRLLSTPGRIRKVFENKQLFRQELIKAGVEPIPGENMLIDELTEKRWDEFRQELGERLVFQITDYTIGGGLGTFFVDDKGDFEKFWQFVRRRREVRELVRVNVCQRVEGKQASITGCVTRFGTVTSGLQTQILDQPELAALVGRSGVWLGHDWNIGFSEPEQLGAEKLCQQWGEYIYSKGYKGIFGLDVMVDKSSRVWPVECNSRYTAAFPMYTMMQLDKQEMPLDVWHLLEWMGVDYEMEIEEAQRLTRRPKQGAQAVLHNLERKWVTPTKTVKAGVYVVKNEKAEWVRQGFSLLDIKEKNELVLCDRVPTEKMVLKPAERIGRLLFKRQIINEKGRLLPEVQTIVKQMYGQFKLMPIESPED